MRCLRHDDLVARQVPARTVIGANHGDTGKLSVCPRHRAQCDRLHAGDLLEHLLQFEQAGEETLAV